MVSRLLFLLAAIGLVALLGCGGGFPSCEDQWTYDAVVALSQENPWYSGGVVLVEVSEGRQVSHGRGEWGPNCEGVGEFEGGAIRDIEFRIAEVEGKYVVGFDYDGRIGIPKSEWDAGRRE